MHAMFENTKSLLDALMPNPLLQETHRRDIAGTVDTCWKALHEVRVAELPRYKFLMRIRGLGMFPIRDSDRALDSFPPRVLESRPPSELLSVLTWDRPRIDVGMDFQLQQSGEPGVTTISTRTRVVAKDPFSAAIFLPYWILIRAGSGLIRRELLVAVARRAERS